MTDIADAAAAALSRTHISEPPALSTVPSQSQQQPLASDKQVSPVVAADAVKVVAGGFAVPAPRQPKVFCTFSPAFSVARCLL